MTLVYGKIEYGILRTVGSDCLRQLCSSKLVYVSKSGLKFRHYLLRVFGERKKKKFTSPRGCPSHKVTLL